MSDAVRSRVRQVRSVAMLRRLRTGRLRFRSWLDLWVNAAIGLFYVVGVWVIVGRPEVPDWSWSLVVAVVLVVAAAFTHVQILHRLGR